MNIELYAIHFEVEGHPGIVRIAFIVSVLAVAGCSAERVQSIGPQQYVVTAKGEQAYARATETCDKQGRKWTALASPPGSPADQFRFECVNSYEIVAAEQDSYRIRVFTPDIPVKHVTVPASQDKPADTQWVLDLAPADKEVRTRITQYCAKANQSVKLVSRTFDAGPGLDIVFKCAPPAAAAP
jgi:hypothetical protein